MSFTWEPITGKYGEKLDHIFGLKDPFVEYSPGKFVMPQKYGEIAQKILDLEVRKDDVWLVSYPRTGSTWLQEMVWLIGNDLDFEGARTKLQHFRAPILEISSILITEDYDPFMDKYGDSVDSVKNCPSPRYIKTHVPLELLPVQLKTVKPKIIYIVRNPKDVCVSYYHYCQLVHHLNCSFEEFCRLILEGKVPVGDLFYHYLAFWNKRHEPNVLFLKYEDMKSDLRAVIRRTAEFLGKPVREDQIEALCDHLDFVKMKRNRCVNAEPILEARLGKPTEGNKPEGFIRKGEIGDWKNYMTSEMSEKFDIWIKENTKGTGLTF